MHELAVVTGGGTGIGRAMVQRLAAEGLAVLAIGRRSGPLEALAQARPDRIETRAADVATPEGRAQVAEAIAGRRVRYLLHNAGVLEPVRPLAVVGLAEWRYAQAVNVEGPLFLTQRLLPCLSGGRVLHVSSGAAHYPLAGWGAYCTAKAALYMLYQVLDLELRSHDIAVGSVCPGVVDTPMQALIREQDSERFPDVERFRELERTGMLKSPDTVADFVWQLLTRTT
ncbi:MAG: SDR family NAD(P)-dependent oxidoreductase, partial [Nitrococcus mobilis]|nr:SDR family NAD(P)-dependent oxidoreductase [Nitrococcus mobilis]